MITQDIRNRIYNLYKKGYSQRKIAQEIGVTLPSVNKIIKEYKIKQDYIDQQVNQIVLTKGAKKVSQHTETMELIKTKIKTNELINLAHKALETTINCLTQGGIKKTTTYKYDEQGYKYPVREVIEELPPTLTSEDLHYVAEFIYKLSTNAYLIDGANEYIRRLESTNLLELPTNELTELAVKKELIQKIGS